MNAINSLLTKRGGDKLNAGKTLLVSQSMLSQCKFSLGSEQHECAQCHMSMFTWCCAQGKEPSKKSWGMQCRGTKAGCIRDVTTLTWFGLLSFACTEPLLLFLCCVGELNHPHRPGRKYVHLCRWTDATNIAVCISWNHRMV